jgi:hypothetical protein
MGGGLIRFGSDGQEKIGCGGDGVGTAEEAMAVGVVSYNDGGLTSFGKAAKVEDDREDGGEAGFATAAQEVGEGIDDDEAGVPGLGELDEFVGGILIAQGVTGQGMDVDGRFRGGAVRVEGGVEASEELAGTGLLVNEQDDTLSYRMVQPRFPHGNANGQIDDGESFLGARITHEDSEARAGEETFDAPFKGRRRFEGIGCGKESLNGLIGNLFGDFGLSRRRLNGVQRCWTIK